MHFPLGCGVKRWTSRVRGTGRRGTERRPAGGDKAGQGRDVMPWWGMEGASLFPILICLIYTPSFYLYRYRCAANYPKWLTLPEGRVASVLWYGNHALSVPSWEFLCYFYAHHRTQIVVRYRVLYDHFHHVQFTDSETPCLPRYFQHPMTWLYLRGRLQDMCPCLSANFCNSLGRLAIIVGFFSLSLLSLASFLLLHKKNVIVIIDLV